MPCRVVPCRAVPRHCPHAECSVPLPRFPASPCPVPRAPCPVPRAPCPVPRAPCPVPCPVAAMDQGTWNHQGLSLSSPPVITPPRCNPLGRGAGASPLYGAKVNPSRIGIGSGRTAELLSFVLPESGLGPMLAWNTMGHVTGWRKEMLRSCLDRWM